jgi:4-alpha-glucanotransferase
MSGATSRSAGLLLPLFSFPSTHSWGIGDIGDLAPMTAWLAAAGQTVLQILPINEMAAGQASPYSAISAMAIDPLYIRVPDVPEFEAIGGEGSLSAEDRSTLAAVRDLPYVDYANVRRLKETALRAAFEYFQTAEWQKGTARAEAFRRFIGMEAWWLDDYALFRALHAREGARPWTEWPSALQRRDPAALDQLRRERSEDILFFQYVQGQAAAQWQQARRRAAASRVRLFGDLPFMVDGHSADVWARQHEFRLDASVGVPPDAFSEAGQDWGMPVYRWDVVAAGGFQWLRDRARRSADLFDGYRVDHLVGFYRTFGRPLGAGASYFTPSDEAEQQTLGEHVLAIFREPGSEIIAEDLGTVPDFVRASLARLGVPGFRVLRWERLWNEDGQPFRDPADYPPLSVATSGTHDTEPLADWWAGLPEVDRLKIAALPTIVRIANGVDVRSAPFDPVVRDILLEALFASGSNLLLIPFPDIFGWRDRINEPATVTGRNWTFRLPWPCDHLADVPEARERQAALRQWAERHGRWP